MARNCRPSVCQSAETGGNLIGRCRHGQTPSRRSNYNWTVSEAEINGWTGIVRAESNLKAK